MIGLVACYRQAWGTEVLVDLINRHGTNLDLMFLAGREYIEPIWFARHEARVHISSREPLAGMQIGQRLAFLKQAAAHLEAA